MDGEAELDRLIGLLYDSVLDETQWTCALQALSDFTGGTGVGEVIANPVTGTISQCATLNIGPEFRDQYLGYYAAKEVRLPPAVKFGVGVVMTEDMLVEQRELRSSEIYNDLLRPFDIPHFMFAWVRKSGSKVQTIAIEGTLSHGAFDERAIARFSKVMPHLIRAARMREHFVSVRDSQHAYREAMETLPFGIVVLDEKGQIIEATSMAERTLSLGQALTQRDRRVHAKHTDDDQDLQRATLSAIAPATHASVSAGTVAVRRAGASALKLTIMPIASVDRFSMAARPSALIIIVDPDSAPRPATSLIQATLGLTRAEASLAHALFSGMSLREAATDLDRSVNTCKAQLKGIYAKTGCRSHVDLAKTLVMTALGERSSNCANSFPVDWTRR
jgi:DNA-binding NarL/FixJ family response regulator